MRSVPARCAPLVALLAACGGGGGLRVGDGTPLDFGTVGAGTRQTLRVPVSNDTDEALTLDSVEWAEPEGGARFQIDLPSAALGPGGSSAFTVTYAPPEDAGARAEPARATIVARTASGKRLQSSLDVHARAAELDCPPTALALGPVPPGDRRRAWFTLTNPTTWPRHVEVGTPTHPAFAAASTSVDLAPGESLDVEISFAPELLGTYVATVDVRAGPTCDGVVLLSGQGSNPVLTWEPGEIDCGLTYPGDPEPRRRLEIRNHGIVPVTLGEIAITNPTAFSAEPLAPDAEGRIVLAAAERIAGDLWKPGVGAIEIVCHTDGRGLRKGALTFATTAHGLPRVSVPLQSFGGGPAAEVTPDPIAFGEAAHFPNGGSMRVPVRVKVRNAGDQNLRLGTLDPETQLSGPPFVAIRAKNPQTQAGEFQVALPDTFDPQTGIPPAPGEDTAELIVTFEPLSPGAKAAELVLFTNVPGSPEVTVPITAAALQLPPCRFSVSAPALDLGHVPAGEHRELGWSLRNDGTAASEVCLVWGADLAGETDPAFTVDEAPRTVKLQPGESRRVRVRATAGVPPPIAPMPLSGALHFSVSSPTRRDLEVPLGAMAGPSCLLVAPSRFDFGDVQLGCASEVRTFSLYATCPSAVTIAQVTALDDGGGAFDLAAAPAPNQVAQPGGAPVTFQVRFEPTALAAAQGSIAVETVRAGIPLRFLVPLRGAGSASSLQTDDFGRPMPFSTDVLFVIDDSGAVSDEQEALGQQFGPLLSSSPADFHVAATTTDMSAAGERGVLVSGPLHPEKTLTPGTVDASAKFGQKVLVGVAGSHAEDCLGAALAAVSSPLVHTDNSGFLRSAAMLQVVCVGDEAVGAQPASYFLDALWNAKGFERRLDVAFHAVEPQGPPAPGALLAAQTGGLWVDVANPAFGTALAPILGGSWRTVFPLSRPISASAGSPEVWVDGVQIPSSGPSGKVWTYDAAANAVVFEPAHVPQPGQSFTVVYHRDC